MCVLDELHCKAIHTRMERNPWLGDPAFKMLTPLTRNKKNMLHEGHFATKVYISLQHEIANSYMNQDNLCCLPQSIDLLSPSLD